MLPSVLTDYWFFSFVYQHFVHMGFKLVLQTPEVLSHIFRFALTSTLAGERSVRDAHRQMYQMTNRDPPGGRVAPLSLCPHLVLGYHVVLEGPSRLESFQELVADPSFLAGHVHLQQTLKQLSDTEDKKHQNTQIRPLANVK